MDDLSTGHREAVPASADFHRLDIGDKRAVLELFSKKRFDAVFHFAAKALIPESVTNPGTFFDKNLVSGIVFLECLRRASIGNFIFSSTAAVYGNPVRIPIREDDPKEPMNAYGESKLALERILRWYCSAYGWSVVAFRYFNASGSIPGHGERHQPETHILPLLLQVASGRRDFFEIYGTQHATPDGTCLRVPEVEAREYCISWYNSSTFVLQGGCNEHNDYHGTGRAAEAGNPWRRSLRRGDRCASDR